VVSSQRPVVAIGRYALEVGGPAGTMLMARPSIDDGATVEAPAEIAEPLATETGETVGERFERATLTAKQATTRIEQAEQLLRSALAGSLPGVDLLSTLGGEMLGVLDSLDRDKRWKEWLRYARTVNTLLALAMRWAKLVGSLHTALRAAERAPQLEAAVGWAQHELGTLHVAVEDAVGAEPRLEAAREIRQRLRDGDGLAATEQSLSVLCRQQARAGQTERGRARRRLFAIVAAVLLLLLAGGVAGAVVDPFDQSTATDVPGTVTVAVRTTGKGEGRVTSRSGIDCPGRCRKRVERGSRIRLDAAAVGDAVFTGWAGGCDGVDRCRLTVVEPVTITARFTAAAPDESTLTVTRMGKGGGTVTSDDDRISCGERCVEAFAHGDPIELTAAADDGSVFTGWSGADCSGTDGCTVTLDGPEEVTATFELESTTEVTLITSTVGSGTIAATTGSDADGQDCTNGCAYPRETAVTLRATLGGGTDSVAWTGCDSTDGTRCDVKMSEDRAVSATFHTTEVE
jgi:hypothetical protein